MGDGQLFFDIMQERIKAQIRLWMSLLYLHEMPEER